MKIINLEDNGVKYVNQFVVHLPSGIYFQSYNDLVAWKKNDGSIAINPSAWDKSLTTKKHLCTFLGVTKYELNEKIKNGEYILADLTYNKY